MGQKTVLVVGRHLVHTSSQLQFLQGLAGQFDRIVYAITSADHQRSRYNPLPLYVRAVGIDRLAREVGVAHRIIGIPHYRPTDRFAQHVIAEIADKTESELRLTPADTIVVTATPAVLAMFEALGFEVMTWPVEDEVVSATLSGTPHLGLSTTSTELIASFPEVFSKSARLHRDPLLDDSGSLTKTRDYDVYVSAMSNPAVIRMKYDDIRSHLREGRLADEGCADGALLVQIAADFPDSDLIGIETTGELLAQCAERQRRGHFGGAYVHFHQRNLFDEVFEPESIDTTICNSTLHELWSYGEGEATIRQYLQRKFRQTAPGGRIVMRDVVGPEDGDRPVLLWCREDDGATDGDVAKLSTAARFERFAKDYVLGVTYEVVELRDRRYFRVALRDAVEMMLKKDYVENWASEMKEQFTFWSISSWKDALRAAGFTVLDASHAYANPWIAENRWRGSVALHELDGSPVPDPPTTMVLVAVRE